MSLYGAEANIKNLEKEVAKKEKKFTQLSGETKIDSLFLVDPDFIVNATTTPLWRDLHIKRNASMLHPYTV